MDFQTITIREYLTRKGIKFTERNGELITKCLFGSCDEDSRPNEAHLYLGADTSQYLCHKCGAKGNLVTLAKHLGDNIQSIALNTGVPVRNTSRYVDDNNAKKIWECSTEPPKDFAYITKKKINVHGARFTEGKLVLPLYDGNGFLSSLQFIDVMGEKKFLAGGKTAGCFWLLGQPENILCIVEGFATGASILEATGYTVAVAFSAGNLRATAEIMRKQYPQADIVICADTDATGRRNATEAAETIGARLAIPLFGADDQLNGQPPSDFNDLYVLQGTLAVKAAVDAAIVIPAKFSFTSLGALLNEPEENISWVVDNLLPSGGFSLMVAKPKVGKSTIARQLALSVARGEPFLGRSTAKGRVLYVSLEEKRQEVKNHFKSLGAYGTEDLGVYIGSAPEDAYKWLEGEVERQRPVLVIVDTLFRFARVADLNDYAKTIAALDPLLNLARTGSHLMGLHHARKSPGDGADSTLGSTAIFGSVDTAIMLKRTEGKRTIETQQRYGVDMEPTVLVFDAESKRTELGGTKEEEDTKKIEGAIKEFLLLAKEPISESTIDGEVDGRTALKRKALRDLLAKGEIVRIGGGKRNDPYLYSCSLVPAIDEKQEKQTSADREKDLTTATFSSSQEFDSSDSFGNKIPLLSPEQEIPDF